MKAGGRRAEGWEERRADELTLRISNINIERCSLECIFRCPRDLNYCTT